MNEINIVTTVGLDPILLHHFIKYYKQLGVDNFYIVVWGDSKKVKYKEIVDVLETHNLEIYKDLRDVNTGDAKYLTDKTIIFGWVFFIKLIVSICFIIFF